MEKKQTLVNAEKLKQAILSKGYTVPQFSKMLATETGSVARGRNIYTELLKRPDMQSSRLYLICQLLKVPMESLFGEGESFFDSMTTVQQEEDSDTANLMTEIKFLRIENEHLKEVIAEKSALIEELKENKKMILDHLDVLLKGGQDPDSNL